MIKRVVLIVETPFSHRDFDRFGIATIQKHGLLPEVWEVHDVYVPRPLGESVVRPTGVKVTRFSSETDLLKFASSLEADDCVITAVGVYVGQEKSMSPLVKALGSSNALVTALSLGHRLPEPSIQPHWCGRLRSVGILSKTIVRDVKRNPRRIPVAIRSAWRRGKPAGNAPLRALDAIWAGTSVERIQPALVNDDTYLTFIHTLDYDLVRHSRTQPPGRAVGKIVYLDSMGPVHPDYLVHGKHLLTNSAEWFASVRSSFDRIESLFKTQIVVVPHPRAAPDQVIKWYGQREVLACPTAQAIRDCDLVLVTSPTTSLGIAAALKKPCIALRTPMIHAQSLARLQAYAETLGIPVLDHESLPESIGLPRPDADKQARFVEEYVKRTGTPDQDFWDVVVRRIAAWGT